MRSKQVEKYPERLKEKEEWIWYENMLKLKLDIWYTQKHDFHLFFIFCQ